MSKPPTFRMNVPLLDNWDVWDGTGRPGGVQIFATNLPIIAIANGDEQVVIRPSREEVKELRAALKDVLRHMDETNKEQA